MAVITIRWKESLLFIVSLICIYLILTQMFQNKVAKKYSKSENPAVRDNLSVPDKPTRHHDHDNDHNKVTVEMSLIELLKPNHLTKERKKDLNALKAELNKLLTILTQMNVSAEEKGAQGEDTIEEIHIEKPAKADVNLKSYVIATKYCERLSDTEDNLIKSLIMVKSVLISLLLYQNDIDKVDIHFIIKWSTDEWIIREKLMAFGLGPRFNRSTLEIHFHNLTDFLKTDYYKQLSSRHKIIQNGNECEFIHLFLPNILQNTDSIIYLPTDTIITGSIAKIWQEFDKMDNQQLIGITRHSTDATRHHPKINGINGVLMMNLTRMRHLNFVDKLLQFNNHEDMATPSKKSSILQFFNKFLQLSSKLFWYPLPCQFNFLFDSIHCTPKNPSDLCQICDCTSNQLGIQIIQQGQGHLQKDTPFPAISEAYQKVNMNDPKNQLILPVKNVYAKLMSSKYNQTSCYSTLNKFTFKNFFS